MKCPHCSHDFPLTWARYLKAPTGKHQCPSCKAESKLSFSRNYIIKLFLPILVLTAISIKLVTAFLSNTIVAALMTVFIALLISIPWDRHCDAARELKPLKKHS